MDNVVFQPVIFLVLLIVLYFTSRQTTNEIFYFLRKFIKKDSVVFGIVSLLFLPGTILHEFSHFFTAIVLFLPVHKLQILPEFEKNSIKLGKVLYEKKDVIRGFLVGIAPLFGALMFFWFLSVFHLFPHKTIWVTVLLGYVIFSVSSAMFSSQQDLIDLIYVIPLFGIVGVCIYLFNINFDFILQNKKLIQNARDFIDNIRFYIIFSVVIHGIVIVTLKSLRKLL